MKYIITYILILVSFGVNAQQRLDVKKRNFAAASEGLQEAWKSLREGNRLFDEGKGTFREAREKYLKAWQYNPDNAELNYNLGICYLFTDEKFEAINYFTKAAELDPAVAPDLKYMLGRANHLTLEFDKAIMYYTDYINWLTAERKPMQVIDWVNRLIEQCRNGKDLASQPQRVVISNLGKPVNSLEDDYNPVLNSAENMLYFTSRRLQNEKSKRNPFDNKFFEDIYFSRYENGKWGDAQRMEEPINAGKNKFNNSAVSLSNEDNQMFIYDGHRNNGDILLSENSSGLWSKPKPVKGKVNTKYRETSLSVTRDGKMLYFVSENKETTLGGADIYISKLENGRWAEPVNIGAMINSKYDEGAARISENDSVLYFSSKGHKSMGGYDIFRSVKMPGNMWSTPENIGYPINTPDDDLFYFPSSNSKSAYYSTILSWI